MKLILNSDVKSLGRKGDVVDVAKGYARNYLLPKKLAVVATSSNLKFAEELQEKREIQTQANDELAESIKVALADAKIVIHRTQQMKELFMQQLVMNKLLMQLKHFQDLGLKLNKSLQKIKLKK